MKIAIISPYRFKAHTKFNQLLNNFTKKQSIISAELDEFGDNIEVLLDNEISIKIILSLPKDLGSALADKYFYVAYIDRDFNEDEVWEIRQHLIGEQKKPIIYF